MTYDSHGQLASETRPDGSQSTITRDVWGRPTEVRVGTTTPASSDHLTRVSFDDLGREKTTRVRMGSDPTQDNAADLVTSKSYDRVGNLLTVTDPRGAVTTTSYDRRGRVVAIDAPIGNGGSDQTERPCSVFEYDQLGNQTKARQALSRGSAAGCAFGASGLTWRETQRSYDARNLQTEAKLVGLNTAEYSGGQLVTSWQYDAVGLPTRVTDPRGNYLQFSYDALGRKLAAEQAVTLSGVSGPGCHGLSGAVCTSQRWEYDAVGNVTREYLPRGSGASQTEETRQSTFDKVQRVLTRVNELGKSWSFSYDGNGNLLPETDPLNHTTTRTYDELNRPLTVKDALNHQTSYSYDSFGNRASLTDPNGNLTTYSYDKANRLIGLTDPLGASSGFGYDQNGNRISLTDPRGKTQTASYDALNRLLSETSPNATATHSCNPTCTTAATPRTASTRYTLDGQRQQTTDFNGTTVSFGYDSARRLNAIDYSDATPDVGYAYDQHGNRTSMTAGGGTTASYRYDELNRLLSETRGYSNVLSYRYDRRDNLAVTYPDGKVITSTYDAAGRLQSLDDWRGSSTGRTSYGYDDANRKTSQSLSTGATSSWSYDQANRLTQVEHRASAGGSVFGRFSYSYDPAGNRLTQTDFDGTTTSTQAFEYDRLHRLIRETPRAAFSPTTYSYDPAGNRLTTATGQTLVENTASDPPLHYSGGWGTTSSANASGGSYANTGSVGKYVDFSFSGSAVSFIYGTGPDFGTVRLTLDPGTPQTKLLADLNQCGPTSWQNERTFVGLGQGAHVLRVTFQDATCDTEAPKINVDAFRAYSEARTYQYDDDNRLLQVSEGGTTTSFQYDKNGSTTKTTIGADVTTCSYDGGRRLTEVKLNGASQASFSYDGNGVRTSKTAGGVTTSYVNESRDKSQAPLELKVGSNLRFDLPLAPRDQSWVWASDRRAPGDGWGQPGDDPRVTGQPGAPKLADQQWMVRVSQQFQRRSDPAEAVFSGEVEDSTEDNVSPGELMDELDHEPKLAIEIRPKGSQWRDPWPEVYHEPMVASEIRPDGAQPGPTEANRKGQQRTIRDGVLDLDQRQKRQPTKPADGPKVSADPFLTPERRVPKHSQVLQETKSGTTRSYLPGVTQYDPAQSSNAQWSYFHQDAQNNRVLSDGGAAVSKRWEYEPFGVLRTQSGTASSDFQYAGEQKDTETGLINLRARYYDPSLGRFISRDTVGGNARSIQSLNRYIYVTNNPADIVDPSGTEGEFDSDDGWGLYEPDVLDDYDSTLVKDWEFDIPLPYYLPDDWP